MEDMGKREPLLSKTRHMLPCNPALLAATTNDAQPALAHLKPEAPEAGDIPGHCMVVEVALDHALQPVGGELPKSCLSLAKTQERF